VRDEEAAMISYEELCEALDRFNRRRRNQAELNQLEGGAPEPALAGDAPTYSFAKQPAEDTHEIDADQVLENK
jgi:benzoyl-CoA reductase/2-hydroxyglutaryl-CoA dehydratase subunit BcrC/BadD/HgdB